MRSTSIFWIISPFAVPFYNLNLLPWLAGYYIFCFKIVVPYHNSGERNWEEWEVASLQRENIELRPIL